MNLNISKLIDKIMYSENYLWDWLCIKFHLKYPSIQLSYDRVYHENFKYTIILSFLFVTFEIFFKINVYEYYYYDINEFKKQLKIDFPYLMFNLKYDFNLDKNYVIDVIFDNESSIKYVQSLKNKILNDSVKINKLLNVKDFNKILKFNYIEIQY